MTAPRYVWVLRIHRDAEMDVLVFRTKRGACRALRKHCLLWWDDEGQKAWAEASDDEIARAYFDNHEDEQYELHLQPLKK